MVNTKHAVFFYGHVDVKLGVARLIAEFLVKISQTDKGPAVRAHLDTTIDTYDSEKHMAAEVQNVGCYGGVLLLEFGKIFRALYVDQRDVRSQGSRPIEEPECENSKRDICACLDALCAVSASAKV